MSETSECLEGRIIDAAYEASDIVESLIAHRVLEASASHTGLTFLTFFHPVEKVIEEIDSIKERLMEIDMGVEDLQSRVSSLAVSSNHVVRGISNRDVVVGLADDMLEIKKRLIGGSSNLEIVALAGMGGIDDFDICVSKLVKLWVVEGLIKSANSKSLEDVAEENLSDLVDRNLVLVSKQSSGEKIKTCKIHDLLRDLCVREAKKVEFFHVSNGDLDHISKGMGVRRLGIHKQDRYFSSFNHQPDMCVRSLLSFHWDYIFSVRCRRLLRVLDVESSKIANFEEFVVELVGLLYLACARMSKLSESLLKLRNLQTVIVARVLGPAVLPSEIWKMSQLRHVKLEKLFWPVEAEEETLVFVLQRLETLSTLWNFRCTQRVLTGIPNLKKLGICYDSTSFDWEYYCLRNLVGLQKLESLTCKIIRPSPSFLKHITFPTSLQKLTLIGGNIPWDDMAIIGSLPDLQVLKLKYFAVGGKKWEPIEGHFLQLIFLLLDRIYLVQWEADNIHFPRLQHLVIKACFDLEEIPSSIGDIPTLQSIKVDLCRDSVVTSAKQILEEQHSSGNDGLQVQIGRSLVPV